MYSRILIPLDGSPIAEQVIPLTKMLAAHLNSRVVLFQAVEPICDTLRVEGEEFKADEQVETMRGQALTYLEAIRRDLAGGGIPVECAVRVGKPAPTILEFVERARIDLVSLATHGRGGLQRWVYGSVAEQVLRDTRVPALLVRACATPTLAPRILSRILVPLDGSQWAEAALFHAANLTAAFDAELLLFCAWDPTTPINVGEYLTETTATLQSQGVRAQWKTKLYSGAAADSILELARDDSVDLIVMSTRGRSGISRLVMGSTADAVLRTSSVPVLLIRSSPTATTVEPTKDATESAITIRLTHASKKTARQIAESLSTLLALTTILGESIAIIGYLRTTFGLMRAGVITSIVSSLLLVLTLFVHARLIGKKTIEFLASLCGSDLSRDTNPESKNHDCIRA